MRVCAISCAGVRWPVPVPVPVPVPCGEGRGERRNGDCREGLSREAGHGRQRLSCLSALALQRRHLRFALGSDAHQRAAGLRVAQG